MPTREEITRQALALPANDRAFLAELLERSVCERAGTDEEFAAYWTAELDRRMAQFERDPSQAVDADTALAEMRQHLQVHQLRKLE